jgi:3-oxoacyl-[acyl-carrier protein] reductase
MDLKINGQLFIVTGASSGLGNAVARALLSNGARVLAVARREDMLNALSHDHPGMVEILAGDLQQEETLQALMLRLNERLPDGIFVNAGGPPAVSFADAEIGQWDEAYRLLVRWKVMLVKRLLPLFLQQKYGRILFSESVSIKQPVENLVLSNSLRMAVAGMAKTLALEVAAKGITVNVIGPGFHDTSAVDRIFARKSELEGISPEEARKAVVEQIPAGMMGKPEDFASLAAWLLSPLAGFVTGQVITPDGGANRYSLG